MRNECLLSKVDNFKERLIIKSSLLKTNYLFKRDWQADSLRQHTGITLLRRRFTRYFNHIWHNNKITKVDDLSIRRKPNTKMQNNKIKWVGNINSYSTSVQFNSLRYPEKLLQ